MSSQNSSEPSTAPTMYSEIGNIIDILSNLHERVSKEKRPPHTPQSTQDHKKPPPPPPPPPPQPPTTTEESVTNNGNCWDYVIISNNKGKISSSEQIKKNEEKDASEADQSVQVHPLNQLDHDLIYMQYALKRLKGFEGTFGKSIQDLKDDLELVLTSQATGSKSVQEVEILQDEIRRISQKFLNLKSKIPPVNSSSSDDSDAQQRRRINQSKDLPNMADKTRFKEHDFFIEFKKIFQSLGNYQSCLLCFAVFPENAVIKKRLLVNWWIGEGFLKERIQGENSSEKAADKLLQEFEEKGFILPVDKKHRGVANSFRMSPLVRSAVITLAKENNFFHFDSEGIPTMNFQKYETFKRACLVYDHKEGSVPLRLEQSAIKLAAMELLEEKRLGEDNQKAVQFAESMALFNFGEKPEQKAVEFEKIKKLFNFNLSLEEIENKAKDCAMKRGRIETLFNVSEEFPEFKYDWFSKLEKIKVLYLGRWQSTVDDIPHIEIESTDYLKGLKNMKELRLLSLQGMSGIQELPSEISYLTSLEILDLRACYNLDKLPDEIGKLKSLTHLDISECFLLDGIPKKLSLLSKLQVLKGFVISDHAEDDRRWKRWCSLKDLEKLEHLRKLTININSEKFQTENLSTVLAFKRLLHLKVSWGGGSANKSTKPEPQTGRKDNFFIKTLTKFRTRVTERSQHVESKLEKLDFQCFPDEKLPSWVHPYSFKNLKNLYIRGGRLNSLEGSEWETVKVLRLKYLNELKIHWKELQELFPKLEYLEKFKCHKVTLCPCDGYGIWEKSDLINLNNSKQQHRAS